MTAQIVTIAQGGSVRYHRGMDTQKIPTRRLSRKQISEGLKAQPMESILLGAGNSKDKRLTGKQIRFAEALAMGDTKAGAYRKAYNTQGKPVTQSHEGSRIAASPAVSAQVEAFKMALEAQRYATPAALRALVIERLTTTAINPAIAPAQQLRALELLGKVTEIAAFTERRELVKTESASNARERLINSLRTAITTSSGDGGRSLLAELACDDIEDIEDIDCQSNSVTPQEKANQINDLPTPPTPIPPLPGKDPALHLLSNPRTESP